jgi:16S rRNA (uracil1498-N3)-methyltransferase
MKRVLVATANEGIVELTGDVFHHLAVVLRVQAGEALEVFDGAGRTFEATVVDVGASTLSVKVGPPRMRSTGRAITIVQGLPKADKFEWVLQKGTELGASAFLPVVTQRSLVRAPADAAKKTERWRRIVEEAARQCGRADVPMLAEPCLLSKLPWPAGEVLVLDEAERTRRLSQAVLEHPNRPLTLVVGPEGGLDRTEVEKLIEQGAHSVSLGPLVLRTETAALAALAVIRHLNGDLG